MTMVWREVALLIVTYPFCIPTNRDCFIGKHPFVGIVLFLKYNVLCILITGTTF